MKNIQLSKTVQAVKIIILALIVALGVQYVNATGIWTAAPVSPPNNNTDAPLNVGIGQYPQDKKGGLRLNVDSSPNFYGLQVYGQSIFNDIVTVANHLNINKGTGDGKATAEDFCLNPGNDPTKCLSYIAPGGPGASVTKIINGSGITIDPTTGVGNVTISAIAPTMSTASGSCTLDGSGTKDCAVDCSSNTIVTGGGYDITLAGNSARVVTNDIKVDGKGWRVQVLSGTPGANFNIYAMCLSK